MRTDPILNDLGIKLHRGFLFLFGAALIAAPLWGYVMVKCMGIPIRELPKWAAEAWPPINSLGAAALFWQPIAIGMLAMAVIYLSIGRWWKQHGDVHRRGARFNERSS
jgi:hypothetical protein